MGSLFGGRIFGLQSIAIRLGVMTAVSALSMAVIAGYWTSREVAKYLKMSIRIASAHLCRLATMGKIVWHGRHTVKTKRHWKPCKVYEPVE
jgi:hypothetical protein